MNEKAFVERKQADWTRLAVLCNTADATPQALKRDEFRELVRLYRRVSSDLALARTQSTNLDLIDNLNSLATRAYAVLYRNPRRPILEAIRNSIKASAQTVRRRHRFVWTSSAIFFGSVFLALALLRFFPDTRDYFVPPGFEASFEGWKSGKHDPKSLSESVESTGFYLSNNPRAAIVTGAQGVASFGLISVALLFNNGALMGALVHEVIPAGTLGFLLTSITPHGVPEITGLLLSGATGLLLGSALINPGRRRRGDALKEVGKDAITLLLTSVVLMFIAAPIEAWFSFNPGVPTWAKMAVSAVSFVAWMLFWTQYGREDEPATPGPAQALSSLDSDR